MSGFLWVLILAIGQPLGASRWDKRVEKTAQIVAASAARESGALGVDSLLRAAQLLRSSHPQLAKKFALEAAETLRKSQDTGYDNFRVVEALMSMDTAEAERVAARLPSSIWARKAMLIGAIRKDDFDRAAALARRELYDSDTSYLLSKMKEKRPEQASTLFREMVDAFPGAKLTGDQATSLLRSMSEMADRDPGTVRLAAARLLEATAQEKFNAEGKWEMVSQFKFGEKTIETKGSRESILLPVGMYLWVLAPEVYRNNQKLFAAWSEQIQTVKAEGLAKAAQPNSVTHMSREMLAKWDTSRPVVSKPDTSSDYSKMPFAEACEKIQTLPEVQRTSRWMTLFRREDLTPDQSALVARQLLEQVPKLSFERQRLMMAEQVLWICVDRQRKEWIRPAVLMIVSTLAELEKCIDKMCEMYRSRDGARAYANLAAVLRQEKIRFTSPSPSLASRTALLDLKDTLNERFDFSLPSVEGREYRLQSLRGKVVLLNFWATW